MRVKAITPIRVGEEELARRQYRYERLSPPSVRLELFDLPDAEGVPRSLDSETAIRQSERLVAEEALRTEPGRYDAVLPDCVLDPGLESLEKESPVAVFGILKLAAGFLSSAGYGFASVTRNRAIGEEMAACLERYGSATGYHGNVVLDLSFEDIADEGRWNEVLGQAGERFAGTGVAAVINGCSAVELKPRPDSPVAFVDPTRLALTILGVVADSGLGAAGVAPSAGRATG